MQEGDEISMTDMAQLIAVDSEEDEEDDPDYEPLSMEEDSIQAQEMVSYFTCANRACCQLMCTSCQICKDYALSPRLG